MTPWQEAALDLALRTIVRLTLLVIMFAPFALYLTGHWHR